MMNTRPLPQKRNLAQTLAGRLCVSVLVFSVFGLVAEHSAPAATLLLYDFTSASLSATAAGNVSGSDITATGFGSPGSTTWNGSSSGNNVFVRSQETNASLVANDDYFEFTLSPNAGYELDLTSLTLDYTNELSGGAATPFTITLAIRSSADGYAANLPSTPSSMTITKNVSGQSTTNSGTIDLSGVSFQNLTSPVTFRIYIWDNRNDQQHLTRLDNIAINGDITAVPEPSVPLLMGLGMIALAMHRSRRSRNSSFPQEAKGL